MIQIIDGFNLPTETPIDSRIVVADATKRLGITSKYHGLRVWEQDTDTPYYWDGNTWVSELDLVVTGVDGNVTDGKIPKFTSINPTKIEDSQISDDGSTVTIDGILDVTDDLTFGGNLNGDIDAVNITTGFLNLDRLDKGSANTNDVLQIDATGVPKFVSLSGISIGSSSTSNQVKLNNVNNSQYYRFILREEDTTALGGGNSFGLFSYETNLWISQISTQTCILAHSGSKENPPYSFYDTASGSKDILGGMYYNVDKLVFSKQNSSGILVNSLVIDNDAVTFGESANFSPRIRTHQDPTDSNEPSYTWWGNDKTGMYRPDDNVIGFSIDSNETVRMDTNGFKTIFGSVTNPSIGFFGTKSIGVPGAAGSVSIQNLDDTGFYGDVNFINPIGFTKRVHFVTGGDNILNFNTYGLEVTDGVGSLTYPSIRFGSGIGFYKDGSSNLIIANGSTQAVSIATNRDVTIKRNLILPDPDGSNPSGGEVLTAADSTGKVEWVTPTTLNVKAGRVGFQSGTSAYKQLSNSWSTWSPPNSFTAQFSGYHQITMVINLHLDFDEGGTNSDDRNMRIVIGMIKNGNSTAISKIEAGRKAKGMESVDGMDRFWDTYTLTWGGYLSNGDTVKPQLIRGELNRTTDIWFLYSYGPNVKGSHLSYIGIES